MRRYLARGAELVANGRIDTRTMITHTLPLSEIAQAFELKREPSGDVIHVMVDCQA
jgi:threonine dehydrogenase-like Zn-dependent dehydrogenase